MTAFTRLLALLTLIPLFATANPKPIIPEPLIPWIDWVLQDTPEYKCPFFFNNHQQQYCAWPGELELSLKQQQGHFSSKWTVYRTSYISLPGNHQHWPHNVNINDTPALVIEHNNTPAIKLGKGTYTIHGDFFWDSIPDSLMIPDKTGLITVNVLGKNIPNPEIKNKQLWLKASDLGKTIRKDESNQLNLQVFRKVLDTTPLQLTTQLSLEVSGKQREIKLPHALLNNFIPISLKSPLPAKLEADGSLLIQVRPGRWQIKILARHPGQLTDLSLAINDPQWPESEIWSFAAQAHLRLVEIEQVTTIDPSQSNIPQQWKNLPAFMLKQGDTMHFKLIRRGDPEPEPNSLSITRQLWLDFAGTGYTVQDQISGSITHGWRLDSLSETRLGHAELNGQTLLITQSPDNKAQGLELRKGYVQLTADSRIENDISSLSTTGWQQKFNQVNAVLHLPPGWHLLAVSGADNAPGSWITRWTLLDLFLVLIAALAVSRLWNNYWGLLALFTLALIWHEVDAPRFIWLNILAAIALIRVLPQGKPLRIMQHYRSMCSLALVIICIPFLVNQVRTGLYPQLENPRQLTHPQKNLLSGSLAENVMFDAGSTKELFTEGLATSRALTKVRSTVPQSKYYSSPKAKFKRIDPNANLQTGPGLPQWQWSSIPLSWNGGVDGQQQVHFWYLDPTTSLLLNFLRVIMVITLGLLMVGAINQSFKFKIPTLAANLCLLILFFFPITPVHAELPNPALLKELKQRLLKAPDCLPSCALISTMQLDINNKFLNLTLQVHAQENIAIPLPAKFKQWLPNSILINGSHAKAIIRDKQGLLWISLEQGIHRVTLRGNAPIQTSFTLPLPLKPQIITHKTRHWTIEGLRKNGTAENQLHFTRSKITNHKKNKPAPISQGTLPAFIKVERTLHLGLDWHITTRVSRVAKEATAVTLKIPLLTGESVSSTNIRSKKGYALIHMTANQQSINWQSLLEKTTQLTLQAPETNQWTEIWRADISPIWHINSSGIAAIHHQDQAGNWLPTWQPWPGERVTLTITRPKAVQGQTLTIDKSILHITSGKRSQETRFELDIRSSKGGQYSLELPQTAELKSVLINNRTQPIRQQQQTVTLPLKPGKQHYQLNWYETKQQSSLLTTPPLNLGIANVNTHLKVSLGQDRWVLLTTGPQLGPAVLFWGVLIVLTLLAFALGRSHLTPLKHWQWFLLLVGLSQVPIISAIIVVAWLMALGLRKQQINENINIFNLLQIILIFLTLGSLAILFVSVAQGLLGSPDMQIAGNHSSAFMLNWYQDRNSGILPTASVISIPLTSYRILMLLWSLWLAISLLNWLKWGWQCFSYQGLWKKSKPSSEPNKSTL